MPTRTAIALTILAALILSGLSTTLLAQPPAPDALPLRQGRPAVTTAQSNRTSRPVAADS